MSNNNMQTQYSIELSVRGADKTNAAIRGIENTLQDITKTASNLDFKDTLKGVSDIESTLKSLRDGEEDATQEMEALGRATEKAYRDLEKQAVKLNFSLSEQGKQQRARIKELQEERAKLNDSADAKKRSKEIDKEINSLLKNVVSASDEELSVMVAQNREARIRLKLVSQESKAYKAQQTIWKGLSRIIKDDNKSWKEKIKSVASYVRGLKLSEDQWKRIYSAAQKVGSIAKIGAGVVGGALAIGGMAMASAPQQAQKEAEARRVKGGGSLEDKTTLVGDLYIKTGVDSSTIVDAINRVYSVLGSNLSREEVIQAATAEVQFPGAAALFRQQNTGTVTAKDFQRYTAKMRALQGATGASVEQIRGSADYIANLRQTYFQNATENDLQSVYLALQGSGAFDNEEEIQRAFRSFARNYNGNQNIFDAAQSYDWSRTAYGATNKQQARKAASNINWASVEAATREEEYSQTAAEKDAERVRKLEETKNRIMAQILKIMEPLAAELEKALDSDTVKKIAEGLVSFLTKVVPIITDILLKIAGGLGIAVEKVEKAAVAVIESGADYAESLGGGWSRAPGKWMADGGITSMPSICGEAGPEAVIPLSYERSGRGAQILQQVEQHFNMSGSETTAASLASMVGSNAFLYETGRIGRLNRRRGI